MNLKSYLPLYLGIAIAIGILIGSLFNFKNRANSIFKANSEEAKIKRLIDYIQYDYVDDVNTEKLLDGAINQIVNKLDPHSVYFTRQELERDNEQMQGNFVGIGVQFVMNNDSVVITKILEGGPSQRVGLKAGDRILSADSDSLSGASLQNTDVMGILKGSPDTDVVLSVYRRSENKILEFPLTRGEVPIKSVPAYYMITDEIGYIKAEIFARTTYDEFKEALNKLQDKGMKKLILDLRDNRGGFMDIANKMADEFLEDKKLIVFTKNKKGEIEKDFATSKGDFEDGQVYILINENSASASEIVAGALQDNDKGTIIGRRSFGKGLVQQTMGLGDGSAIRLTISRYYTPTGRSIQKPYEMNHGKEYYDNFYKRFERGELVNADSIKVNDSLMYTTPKGKIVYGGGGIVPDKFVAIDTTQFIGSRYTSEIEQFTFKYVDDNREILKNWSLESFISNFDKDHKILNEYLKRIDVKFPLSNKKREIISRYLRASIARELFDDSSFYQIIQQDDNMIERVLELESTN
ncbi:S41 family peptidase [Urechidicola croceus]|uniref:Peptidase S41 n=1 Tax=Urechidicola croceus TaxID=1850246 RepID=A0A1D8P9N2_9FLAO|nr:S41 family peptidase [Urechidicola croceus]AOW21294.1 peptidase S41 [Urechidicola croceus]